jgi:hypothetical protein
VYTPLSSKDLDDFGDNIVVGTYAPALLREFAGGTDFSSGMDAITTAEYRKKQDANMFDQMLHGHVNEVLKKRLSDVARAGMSNGALRLESLHRAEQAVAAGKPELAKSDVVDWLTDLAHVAQGLQLQRSIDYYARLTKALLLVLASGFIAGVANYLSGLRAGLRLVGKKPPSPPAEGVPIDQALTL